MDFEELDLLPGSENVVNFELYHDSAGAPFCACCRAETPLETSTTRQHAAGVHFEQEVVWSGG